MNNNNLVLKQQFTGININLKKERRHNYLDYLIFPNFQGANRVFVLSYEDIAHQTSYKMHFLPTVEIKDYNVMIDGRKCFDQPVKNDLRTYELSLLLKHYKIKIINKVINKHMMLIQKQFS